MSETDLGPRKTLIVIVIVVGCFAVLWPKVFYPMLVGPTHKTHDYDQGCCDVFSDTDINTIKIISELCNMIASHSDGKKQLTNQEIASNCRNSIFSKCGIDISPILKENVYLDRKVKDVLEKIRSLNGSLCLKYQFNVSPWVLGVPHKTTTNFTVYSVRQERPVHLRPEMLHPALRERGRAIPPSSAPRKTSPPPKIVEGRPRPIPGMRPPMGGAGHVVPSPQKGNSISVIMPIYTIGIVIFFAYTLIKVIFKKKPESPGFGLYPTVEPDRLFRKEVFESNKSQLKSKYGRDLSGKLGWEDRDAIVNAMSALLDEVDQELESRWKSYEVDSQQNHASNGSVPGTKQDQTSVKVLGMETTASCEGGQKWSRPNSPIVSPTPPPSVEEPEPPQEIYLEGALPAQSQLLVSDSKTETQPNTDASADPAVVLASKMTLSVISLDSLPETENGSSSSSGKDREEYEFISNSDLNPTQHEEERDSQEIPAKWNEKFSKDLLQAESVSEGEISNDEVDIEVEDVDYRKNENVREIAQEDLDFHPNIEKTLEKINTTGMNVENTEELKQCEVPTFTENEKHSEDESKSRSEENLTKVAPAQQQEYADISEQPPTGNETKSAPEIQNRELDKLPIQQKPVEENDVINFGLQDILKVEEVREAINLSLQSNHNLEQPLEVQTLQKHKAFGQEDSSASLKLPENESRSNSEIKPANNEQQNEGKIEETEAELTKMAAEIIDEITNAAKATFELNNSPSEAVLEAPPIADDDEMFSKYMARIGNDYPIEEISANLLLDSEISQATNNENKQEKESRSLKLSPQGEIIEENYFTLEGSPVSAEEGNDDMLIVEEVVELSDEEYERLERELEEKEREKEETIETAAEGATSLIDKPEEDLKDKVEHLITSLESAKDLIKDDGEGEKKEKVTDLDDDLNDFDFNKELERIKKEMSAFGITVDEDAESSETDKDVRNSDQPNV